MSFIDDHIDQISSNFAMASTGLFSVNHSDKVERDHGRYGYLFVKPSNRLSATLTSEREILVLISAFPDQQVRTIKVAKEIISESKGRLEPLLAVIIHNDEKGNAKLKNWGRESNLSVLPLYFNGSFPSGNDMEKALCYELFSNDPFDITGPVSDDAQFYGRRTEAQEIAKKLQLGQIRSCIGVRKIGKTSIINRIVNDLKGNHDCYCIFVDCSKDSTWGMNASQIISSIANSIKHLIGSRDKYQSIVPVQQNVKINKSIRSLTEAITNSNKPTIIIFDEVDYITPSSPTADNWKTEFNVFWRNIRAIYQESLRNGKVVSILISGVSSKWFLEESIYGVENAALSFIPEEYLSPLPRLAAISMIKRIGRTAGFQFSDPISTIISSTCGDMPFWIRKSCSFIHRSFDISVRPLSPDEDQISTSLSAFIASEGSTIAYVALRHLFKIFPELENIAIGCYHGNYDKSEKHYLSILKKYGIITLDTDGKPEISGKMLLEGLRSYIDRKESSHSSSSIKIEGSMARSSELDEWAEDIAILGKRRNKLERQMRQRVASFIMFDSLSDKKRESASHRICKILPEELRKKYSGLSADDVIEKFLWTDLIKLIAKEWDIFQRVFKDQSLLQSHSGIINDRYDAHAKLADLADFALYRRSLVWFETMMAESG